jgi:bifunctional non-homologous end joining protein LigD
MSLQPYRRKRNFKKTPEPSGRKLHTNGVLHFVVQKHDASHLHFDFRLENHGVLKSWAVPKGISTDPQTRRLAIEVEDHPFDYRDFEGTIPEGNYGAGTVMVWDQGEYFVDPNLSKEENEKKIEEALRKGHLSFYLNGKKLHGAYTLVRLHGHGREDGRKPQWFLIKKDDDFARKPIANEDESVATGRTLDEIAENKPKRKTRTAQKSGSPLQQHNVRADLSQGRKAPMPRVIDPMLATLTERSFDGKDWIFEVKWDGYRIIAQIQKGDVRLYSRNNKTYTDNFPEVAAAFKKMPDMILDGEIVVVDDRGVSQFQLLQNYMRDKRGGQLVYYVFDVVYCDGYELHHLPLIRRKEILRQILPDSGYVRFSQHLADKGKAFYQAAKEHGLEGVIAKNAGSTYQFGRRGRDWLKIKAIQEQEAVICGFTAPRGSRKFLGALILGLFDQDGQLRYIGHTGGGFDEDSLKDMHKRLQPLITDRCPFKTKPKTNAPVTWVKPQLMCQVKFQEWTADGSMRQPIFLGMREDKKPQEIHQELPLSTEKIVPPAKAGKEPLAGRVKFSNLDKIYWPNEGFTKGDMIKYYQGMMPYLLPYLKGRPMVLRRHTNGIEGGSFFHKNMEDQPEWIRTSPVQSDTKEVINYLICEKADDVLYMANLGCIEMNPWPSTVEKVYYPDYMVLDFDPGPDIGFNVLVDVVAHSKKVLVKAGIPGFCKTSGGRGLHVYIPLGKQYTYQQTTDFAQVICMVINQGMPDVTSLERSPHKRKALIYLDYLQNHYGATMASVYSLRPRPGATVSAPLEWKEVRRGLDPRDFNIHTMAARLKKKGDLWKGVLGKGIDIKKALAALKL